MSTIAQLLTDLHSLDIKLWLDGERLRYDAPKGAFTAALRSQLRARKAEIVAYLQQVQGDQVEQIPTVARDAALPLSFSQQRLWFLAQLEGSRFAYNMPAALRLSGPLDVAGLNASWQAICERHEVLRTTFPMVDGQARQQINPTSGSLELIDLSHLPKDQHESEVTRLSRQEAKHAFDLINGPLWRVTLLRLAREEHVLLVTMHHIISDGWSIEILIRELSALYAAHTHHNRRSSQPKTGLPALSIQYADFAVWQRSWLSGDVLQQLVEYWKKQLADAPPLLTLPTDHARPAQQRYQGAHLSFPLPKALTSQLADLSQKNNTTLFMTLQAAFAVLLSRYSAQEEILIGTPIANRQVADVENLIGFFVNTLVLRNDLSGNPSFRELLARVRQVTLDAYQHQALPFELLVETVQPERSLSHSPLFQVMFTLEHDTQERLSFSDVTVTPIEVEYPVAKFDLTLTIKEREKHVIALWQYNTDLFEPATIRRMAQHFQTLLTGIVANPLTPIAHLPLLSESEKHQLLVEWNDTATDYPFDKCIHQLFEEQAARTPDAVAVVFEQQQLTYHDLNKRANQLAHYLIAQGVGPDVLVGICVFAGIEMMVAILGVLKAGGAYVPLDPNYPAERLAFMFSDAQVKLTLTHASMQGKGEGFSLLAESRMFDLASYELSKESPENPVVEVEPTNLAYVIYTSGSTGRPKGVMIAHQGLVNYLSWSIKAYPLTEGSGIPVNGSFNFDGTIPTLLAPLLVGQRLILLPEENQIEALSHLLREAEEKLSLVKGTPTHLKLLNDLLSRDGLGSGVQTKALVVGGEALAGSSVSAWWEKAPKSRVFNQYGPTEATVACSFYEVTKQTDLTGMIPIGRPIANTQLYILDRYLQPVPIGVAGELHIGGVGLARGYKGRPQLTSEKFIRNPFGRGKLYKTGDLCRYLPKSCRAGSSTAYPLGIEFLGRADYQVKIRGFRIELGEIEANLRQCAGVREAVVLMREEAASKRLVAYVVIEDGVIFDAAHRACRGDDTVGEVKALRAALKDKLPDYMIPSAFVQLETMPLTSNGKINRRALPAPREVRQDTELILPRTPVESTLATIWQDTLGVKEVGVTDNFFQIGGDSIISIQIVSRAKEAGIHLTPRQLFQYQTIAELASVAHSGAVQEIQAEQGIVTGTLPLTPIQHWFFEQKQKIEHFNQSVLLELTSEVNPTWLEEALRALLTHHDALRLRFWRDTDGWRQEIRAPEAELPFEVIELTDLSKEVAAVQKRANELQASLDLSQGPLLRVALFTQRARRQNRSKDHNRLLIVIHHLAVDGVSWRILLEDLQTAYQQLANGQTIHLPAKTTSFKEWATLLNENGATALCAERDYWAQLRADRADNRPLPVDYAPRKRGDAPRKRDEWGPNDNASAAQISTRLSAAQTEALLNEVPAIYQTQINDLLLTALLLAFQEWTGYSTLLLHLEGHGREHIFSADESHSVDLSRTVGWFTSIFPVRLDMSRGTRERTTSWLGDAIKSIKEQLRAIPNRGMGYGILRYLNSSLNSSSADMPEVNAEVSFNYLGQFDQIASSALSLHRPEPVEGPKGGSLIKALANESSGEPHSPLGRRTYLLEINSMVVKGALQVDFRYSRNFHRAETIQALADSFIDTLVALIAHCQESDAGGYTPSDFPEAELNQEELDDLLSGLKL